MITASARSLRGWGMIFYSMVFHLQWLNAGSRTARPQRDPTSATYCRGADTTNHCHDDTKANNHCFVRYLRGAIVPYPGSK